MGHSPRSPLRLVSAATVSIALSLGAYACDSGTFPNALPVDRAEGGVSTSEDAGAPPDAAADVATSGDAGPVKDGGTAPDAGPTAITEAGASGDGGGVDGASGLDGAAVEDGGADAAPDSGVTDDAG